MAAAAVEPAPLAEAEGEIDERFEYDAPRFYDFDEGSPTGERPDSWFDTEGPKGKSVGMLCSIKSGYAASMYCMDRKLKVS